MYNHCEDLTTGPELPAPTLAEGCYSKMFYECKPQNATCIACNHFSD
nr:MAG TPA: hypothetical protein [Caudoviricetes sp.]